MDQWEFVGDLMRLRDGHYGFLDLFSWQGEHRIFTSRLSFFVDYYAFALGNLSVVLTAYLVLAGLAALLSAVAARERSWSVKAVVFAGALPSLWSLAGRINLGWAFQLGWAYVHALPACAVVLFAAAGRRSGARAWTLLAAACLFDALGVVSLASGLCTVVPVVAVAVWTRSRPALLGAFVLFHILVAILYLQGYEASEYAPVFDPLRLVGYLVPYLGAAFPRSPRASMVVGGVGLALAVAAMTTATVAALRGRRLDPATAALLGVAAFVLAEGVATSIGRAGFPDPTALALRYGTPSEVFWTALVLSAWRWLGRNERRAAARGLALAAIAGVVADNIVGGLIRPGRSGPRRSTTRASTSSTGSRPARRRGRPIRGRN